MTASRNSPISQRKKPKQARANDLISAILEASVQVLTAEGAQRFTTARVAERAGVSVGSLYQYFPNKAAILFRLQSDEWERTTQLFQSILLDDQGSPLLERLRKLVAVFLRSECDEVAIRRALDDAAPLYRDAPETEEVMQKSALIFEQFMQQLLPTTDAPKLRLVSSLILNTLTEVGERFSDAPRSEKEITAYANSMADMFCCYIQSLES
ncbi:TetR family transcriptional regulator [Hahella sp. HN01]|uniref:TetR family transcriptional regulator n=1 Tax=Hahella sp. HN01 TaxID=2847262 RepID=UPI001C1ECCD0|nr:TetR family transcriptional regulator [Hahella sp. HN01]MBU6955588.1 TetR family transcriptional regulator [Hahella sp. HN01]